MMYTNKRNTLIFKLLKEDKINEAEASLLLEKEKEYINSGCNYNVSNWSYPKTDWAIQNTESKSTSGCCNSSCDCKK